MSNESALGSISAIILAAGAATRMGKPKQLLPYRHGTLLQHTIEQAVGAGFRRVVVVIGAYAPAVQSALDDLTIEIVLNEKWESGMGSSIVSGIKHLLHSDAPNSGVAILLSDQPLIRSEHLAAMRLLFLESDFPVVAARYGGTLGVPAFFHPQLFPILEALPPSSGARHLLNFPGTKVLPFDLPEAAVDIDTPEEFEVLRSSTSSPIE